jgi:hypothetical protein
MYVAIMLFNGWSVAYPKGPYQAANPWQGHPFNLNNNINDIDGDINGDDSGIEIHTLSNQTVTARQEAYVKKVIETVMIWTTCSTRSAMKVITALPNGNIT